MLFKPSTVACLWDTWLYYENGTHYLFYLFNSRRDAYWDGMGLATSSDGIHFTDHGPIIHKADGAMWLGTGMTWKVGAKYYINFSELNGEHQEIHFAESDDLRRWRRLPREEAICRLDLRWYAANPALSPQRWDCIWVLPDESGRGYTGFLTAVAKDGPVGMCGTAGCVTSEDGLHFQAAPPVIPSGYWGDGLEVGAVEKIGSRYYMLLGVFHAPLGARYRSRLPGGECGMYVASAGTQRGPYEVLPGQPLLLGSSPSVYTYFARFYRCGEEMLVNHHTVARTTPHVGFNAGPDVMFAPLKRAVVDEAGILRLGWWAGNEALKHRALPAPLEGGELSRGVEHYQVDSERGRLELSAPANGFAFLPYPFQLERGVVIEAVLCLDQSTGPLSSVGMFVESHQAGIGTLVLLQTDGWCSVGKFNGYSYKPEDSKPFAFTAGQPVRLRLLLRDPYLEVYLDDVHVQSYTLNHPAGNRLAFVVEAGAGWMESLATWEMPF
jgi:hypothetical protein